MGQLEHAVRETRLEGLFDLIMNITLLRRLDVVALVMGREEDALLFCVRTISYQLEHPEEMVHKVLQCQCPKSVSQGDEYKEERLETDDATMTWTASSPSV